LGNKYIPGDQLKIIYIDLIEGQGHFSIITNGRFDVDIQALIYTLNPLTADVLNKLLTAAVAHLTGKIIKNGLNDVMCRLGILNFAFR